jgi:2-polyprenyl-6-hydroxyphenyl methylase/3-demethylubiquinone-9 3-methyltransferase
MTMTRIAPCLWFDGNAEAAAQFYARTFPDSQVGKVLRAPKDYPGGKAGNPLTVEFTVLGMDFVGLNGGAHFTFNEAVSFQIYTDDQAQTDRYWDAITADGGQPGPCGWCKDKFGLSWQIVPRRLIELINEPDKDRAKRAMDAMMQMQKIDIAATERAAAGEAA